MNYSDFAQALALQGKALAITRLADAPPAEKIAEGCSLSALNRAFAGETILFTADAMKCPGARAGFGLSDGLPDVPGGVGHFLSHGRGEGFPPGERIKKTPALGEAMMLAQPQGVMQGFAAIEARPFEEGLRPDTVTCLVNPDQLSALIHIFAYESTAYDSVILPMVSGCASVFRLPFGELERNRDARVVVGNVDVFSRPHFPADTFFFTVSGDAFTRMLDNADESVLASPIWKGVARRLHPA